MTTSIKKFLVFLLIILVQFIFISPQKAYAVTPPDRGLGAADSYAVFGKSGVTTTGVTHVWGNAGADSSVGLILSQVDGSINTGAGVAGVETDARSTYDSLMDASQGTPATPTFDLAGTNTIGPGVYNVGASTLNGDLTLSGAGVYIFRSSSSNTTAHSGRMILTNGACASNVFWAITDAMTIGTGAHVEGTIIAHNELISLATGATLVGRAISLISQVTLDANQITQPICAAVTPTPTPTPTPLSCSGDQHLDAAGLNCVSWSQSEAPQTGGTTSTGQVLGTSTLASTGSFDSIAGLALMLIGSVMTLGSLYAFKKRAI